MYKKCFYQKLAVQKLLMNVYEPCKKSTFFRIVVHLWEVITCHFCSLGSVSYCFFCKWESKRVSQQHTKCRRIPSYTDDRIVCCSLFFELKRSKDSFYKARQNRTNRMRHFYNEIKMTSYRIKWTVRTLYFIFHTVSCPKFGYK